MKKQNYMTQDDETPSSEVSNMLLGKSGSQLLTTPEIIKQIGQSGNDMQL